MGLDIFLGTRAPLVGASLSPSALPGPQLTVRTLTSPLRRPPLPRHVELPRPDPSTAHPRLVFGANVVPRVAPIGDRPTLSDQPAIQIHAAGAADRHRPPVAIGIAGIAGHGRSPHLIRQGQGCLLPAAPPLAGWTGTELAALWRVDAVEADAHAMDLDGVAVDDACYAYNRRGVGRAGHRQRHGNASGDCQAMDIPSPGQWKVGFGAVNRSIIGPPISVRSKPIFPKALTNEPCTNSSPQALSIDAPLGSAVVVEDGHDGACALVNDEGHILDAVHSASKVLANI
jgi:hypothetical protein